MLSDLVGLKRVEKHSILVVVPLQIQRDDTSQLKTQ